MLSSSGVWALATWPTFTLGAEGIPGMQSPPDKRRRRNADDCSALWDDDDIADFTHDQLENIDNMIACSQMVTGPEAPPARGRFVGRGASRTQSLTDSKAALKPHQNAVARAPSVSAYARGGSGGGSSAGKGAGTMPASPTAAASTGSCRNSQNLPTSDVNHAHCADNNCRCDALKEEVSEGMPSHRIQSLVVWITIH